MNLPRNPVIRLLASTALGCALLAAVIIYLSAVSIAAARDPRLNDLYGHWALLTLSAALAVNIILATALRVPFRPARLGAWCSHAGVIVLMGAAAWYAAFHVSGECLTMADQGRWSAIDHFFVNDTYAIFVSTDPRQAPVQTPLGVPGRLNASLAGLPEGFSGSADLFLPRAELAPRWQNDSPAASPAVILQIDDLGHSQRVTLCPDEPEYQQFGGRGYAMIYYPDSDPRQVEQLAKPAAGDRGPGMPYDVAMVLSGPQVSPVLVVVRPDGSRWKGDLDRGRELAVPLAGRTVGVTLLERLDHASLTWDAQAVAGASAAAVPAVRVTIRGSGFERTSFLPFASFENASAPLRMDLGGGKTIWLNFSRRRVDLPATVQVTATQYLTHPGTSVPQDYICEVTIAAGGLRRQETLRLNEPVQVGAYQLSQGSWQSGPDGRVATIRLLVASRPALWLIWTACAMICAGLLYGFYAKPLLMRRAGKEGA
ncbi:MAG: hypothetical protein ABFD92_07295 [Planctomycetaceae bacterium]|nr:hypothetical protein [Planctomycetaceae bacterium]